MHEHFWNLFYARCAIFYRNLKSQLISINKQLPLLPTQQNFLNYLNRPAIKWARAYFESPNVVRPQISIFLRIKHWLHICIFYQMWRIIILKRNGKDQKRSKRWILAWKEISELRHGTSVVCDNVLSSKNDNREKRTLRRTWWRKELWMSCIGARIWSGFTWLLCIFVQFSRIK